MAYVPYKTLEIDTNLSLQEVSQIMKNSIAPLKWIQPVPSPKPFIGNVNKTGFAIHRAIGFRNSWQPIAYGSYKEVNGKTHVSVIISWHWSTLVMSRFFSLGSRLRCTY